MLFQAPKKPDFKVVILVCVPLFAMLLAVSGKAQDSQDSKPATHYSLATASTGGTYYPVGVAIATLSKVRLKAEKKLELNARSSAGSAENVQLLRDNAAQFALLQSLHAAWAWHGKGEFAQTGEQKYLRSVTNLWLDVEHFVVLRELVKSGGIDDLRHLNGAKFSIGQRYSGTEGSGHYILNALNIDISNNFKLVHLSYGESADAIRSQRIQAMNVSGGVPVSAITRAFSRPGETLHILKFNDAQLEKINQQQPFWSRYEIPANTYPNQPQAVQTIAQPNILAVREDVDAEHVYLITQLIYDNLAFLNGVHPATKTMSLDNALTHLPMPLHPGAARYYSEQGLDITHAAHPTDEI